MAIDGLIIIDPTGRPIVQTGFRAFSSSYPLLHIDTFNNAVAKAKRAQDIDPVLYVPSYEMDTPSACCHVEHNGLKFLCPISGDIDPLYAFAFLRTFIEILQDYFGDVTGPSLKDNFDVVYQLLEETLDSGGHPLTTSPNALRDIVIPPSLLNKILSVAGVSGLAGSGAHGVHGMGAFSSPIPWRKAGVRYNTNEIYFDVAETLKAVVNKSGVVVTSSVLGKIEANSKLSGTPDLLLTFTNAKVISEPSFHPCIRLTRFSQSKVLSFVPPDGHFTLMEYRYSPAAASGTTPVTGAPLTAVAQNQTQVQLPFLVKSAMQLNETGGTFDVSVTSRLSTRAVEDFVLEIYLGESVSSASCNAGSGAEWSYIPSRRVLRWSIPSLPPSSGRWTLQGSFITSTGRPRPSRSIQTTFSLSSHLFSALKVDQLKLSGETYKPYKGVRGRSEGMIEWRVDWIG
ncbi:clathrin adaptor mu subunit [Artomyces pyxidatus]|uniref:Clathrin adaptor mu subunit n=1 Tax=Artomyces pyxidatus TaxID=48021 RepID=A0ACB8TL93_9AGAM|nr:clathrin adaptor mu subunit [Artomyces pyxidatus]